MLTIEPKEITKDVKTDITNNELRIVTTPGNVELVGLDEFRESASKLATKLTSLEITEENLKESKKMVAEVRKKVNSLKSALRTTKSQMLEPFEEVYSIVEEINHMVSDSENVGRNQIRELEQAEKDKKAAPIADLWDERIDDYWFHDILEFDSFLQPKFLNKGYSMDKIENDLVDFLEGIDMDIKSLLSSTLPHGKEIVTKYLTNLDQFDRPQALTKAIQEVTKTHEIMDKVDETPVEEISGVEASEYKITTTWLPSDVANHLIDYLRTNHIAFQLETQLETKDKSARGTLL